MSALRRLLGQDNHLKVGSNPASNKDSTKHVFRSLHNLDKEGDLAQGVVNGHCQCSERYLSREKLYKLYDNIKLVFEYIFYTKHLEEFAFSRIAEYGRMIK